MNRMHTVIEAMGKQLHFICAATLVATLWIINTQRHVRPLVTFYPGKLHSIVSVSVRSRARRSGQHGSSEWGTLRWIINYLIPDLLLAAS